MAHPEHLKVIHRGVEAWNRWRSKHRGTRPDLSRADLRESNLRLGNLNNADLRGANLEGANLGRAYLEAADLGGARQRGIHLFGADLGRADLRHADLVEAQLWHARLEEADLGSADLRCADLRYADLTRADLAGANLEETILEGAVIQDADLSGAALAGAGLHRAWIRSCRLEGADLAGAVLARTALNDLDLSRVDGLAGVEHEEPSSVGLDTLESTAAGLARDPSRQAEVESFFKGAGVREPYLEIFRERIRTSFGFYSAFIRYSHADRAFARRLYQELQERGVRCWLHEHPMLPGDDVHEELALGSWNRLILLVSEAACTSWWIDAEITHVLDLEAKADGQRGEARLMVPAALDDYLAAGRWHSPEADRIGRRLACDFVGWTDDDSVFERGVDRLAAALRV